MKKDEIRYVLEELIKQLDSPDIPEEFGMSHCFDTGGYGGDLCEIYDFDINFQYDKEDNVLMLSYFGDENPGTPGMPT